VGAYGMLFCLPNTTYDLPANDLLLWSLP
jgi:hypothetical protein